MFVFVLTGTKYQSDTKCKGFFRHKQYSTGVAELHESDMKMLGDGFGVGMHKLGQRRKAKRTHWEKRKKRTHHQQPTLKNSNTELTPLTDATCSLASFSVSYKPIVSNINSCFTQVCIVLTVVMSYVTNVLAASMYSHRSELANVTCAEPHCRT